jgi:hypothetical protein
MIYSEIFFVIRKFLAYTLQLYMLATALDTDLPTGTSPGPPLIMSSPVTHPSEKALNQMLYLIAICIIKSNA